MKIDFEPIDINFYLTDGILTNISEKITAYARQAKSLKFDETVLKTWIDDLEKLLLDYKYGLVSHRADNTIIKSIDDFIRKIKDVSSISDFAKETDIFVYQLNDMITNLRNNKNGQSYISMFGTVEPLNG